MAIIMALMLLTGSAHIEPATVFDVKETAVICETDDQNLYAYDAVNPQISQGDSVTLVMSNTGEIIAAW